MLHTGHDDQVQRLAIALRRGSYVRPHVHSAQWEMLILLHGAADVLFFTPDGRLTERTALSHDRTGGDPGFHRARFTARWLWQDDT